MIKFVSPAKLARALLRVKNKVETAVGSEASARTTAIQAAVTSEIQARDTAISNAIAAEVTNRNAAIGSLDEVVVKHSAQTLTDDQKTQARNNIGVSTITQILQAVYPVGAIYIATVATDPATLFGFGTWERIGEGRTLIDCGNTYTAGSTGGSADAIVPYHTHTFTGEAVTSGGQSADHTHSGTTGNNSVGHTHTHSKFYAYDRSGSGVVWGQSCNFADTTRTTSNESASHTHSFTSGGVSAGHTHSVTAAGSNSYAGTSGNTTGANMPPYAAVYMWKRTS